jgi:tetratricopeptide (TPR) repeat protein
MNTLSKTPRLNHVFHTGSAALFAVVAGVPLGVGPVAAQEETPLAPRITEWERIVKTKPPGQDEYDRVNSRKLVKRKEFVRAEKESRATIRITDDRLFRVKPDTEIRVLPESMPGEPIGIEMRKGAIHLLSREPGRGIRIVTPNGDVITMGTEFHLEVGADGTTTLRLFEGEAELTNPHGKLRLSGDDQGIIEAGRAPRRTARLDARNIIQWCLYYPGVLYLPELPLSQAERRELAGVCLAYTAGDLLGAVDAWPRGYHPRSPSAKALRAMVLLSVGEVDYARAQLAGVPANTPALRAIEEMIDAVKFVRRSNLHVPSTAGEWLARSYYYQSRAQLDKALDAARRAFLIAPDCGNAAVRVAELEFSHGQTSLAAKVLEKGIALAPRNAQAYALWGFLLADQNCIIGARAAFQTAIDLDGALGNAWLGRGLCSIRSGRLAEGRRDLQMAVVLEPSRALLHSYFAKASAQMNQMDDTERDINRAISLDPNDPTPFLYSALVRQQQYRTNRAIADLEKSQRLNDNRRLYRSKLMLDQDRAVRGANLAALYQAAGMTEVAVREAARAVESDYTNPSAHLFLANSFDILRDPRRIELRHETPWFNELLLANLLGPVGGGPLSQYVSQQEYSRLLEADGVGASTIGEVRSDGQVRAVLSAFGTHGRVSYGLDVSHFNDSGNRLNSDAKRTEIYGQIKLQATPDDIVYLLGKWQDQESGDNFETYDNQPLSPGLRFEETQEPGLLLAGWNHRWKPGSHTLFLGGRLAAEQVLTDPASRQFLLQRDPSGMRPGFVYTNGSSQDVFTDPALQSAVPPAVNLGADSSTLIYSPALLQAIAPYLGGGAVTGVGGAGFDFATRREFEIYSAEIQHIEQREINTFLAGARWQSGGFETDARLSILRPTFAGGFSTPTADQHTDVDFQRSSLYAYDYWRPAKWLTLIGGLSWDHLEHPDNFRNPPVNDLQREDEQWSGKLGFTSTPLDWLNLRGAYARGIGGVSFDESVRLEPSQVAGFGQAYRTILSESIAGSVEAPEFETWGLGIDGTIPDTRTWWGLAMKAISQDVERTIGTFDGYDLGVFPNSPAWFPGGTPQQLDYEEHTVFATLNHLIGEEFAVGLGYRASRSTLHSTYPELLGQPGFAADLKDRATLHEVSLSGSWSSPTGFFARAEANWFHQSLDDDPRGLPPGGPSRNGDAFWQLNAMIGYRFWQNQGEVNLGVLNLLDTDYHLSPLTPCQEIARDRTAVLSCRLSF